jgi:threonine dehydratase
LTNNVVTLEDILQAQKTIAGYAVPTAMVRSKSLSELCSSDIFLKLENNQLTHSFKIRGVLNKLLNLSLEEKTRGVVTASAGNHG